MTMENAWILFYVWAFVWNTTEHSATEIQENVAHKVTVGAFWTVDGEKGKISSSFLITQSLPFKLVFSFSFSLCFSPV